MASVRIYGDVHRGQLRLLNRAALVSGLAGVPDGTPIRGEIEIVNQTKRERLERFYVVVVRTACEHFGNYFRDQHQAFWLKLHPESSPHLSYQDDLDRLDEAQLSAYVQDCVQVAAEFGCVISEKP